MKVVVAVRAYSDMQRIYLFEAERDQAFAEKRAGHINRQFENISRFPELGRLWPDPDGNIRRLVASQQLIFYRVNEEAILILRVLDGRMDVETELLR
jgi:toxin ParE1/3/4